MAKKRKETEDDEEDDSFKIPKFDKKEYVKEQKRNIKTYYISLAFGLLIAIVSAGFFILLEGNSFRWPLVLLFGILTGSWLRYLYLKLNIETEKFDKKTWFSNYAIYFFTWLVILIVLINPPVYDSEPPKVEIAVLPDYQEIGGDVVIVAKISDNSGVNKEDITFKIDNVTIPTNDFEFIENKIFKYVHVCPDSLSENETKTYDYEITVKDKKGLESDPTSGTFTYGNDAISLASSEGKAGLGDAINFVIKDKNVFDVYYTINNRSQKIYVDYDSNSGYYTTYPRYWSNIDEGENVTLQVYAVFKKYFQQPTDEPEQQWSMDKVKDYNIHNNTIEDTSKYTFEAASDIEGETPPGPNSIKPKKIFVGVPGFELIILVASLVIAIIIHKRRKRK
jgi:hypothetical protein